MLNASHGANVANLGVKLVNDSEALRLCPLADLVPSVAGFDVPPPMVVIDARSTVIVKSGGGDLDRWFP